METERIQIRNYTTYQLRARAIVEDAARVPFIEPEGEGELLPGNRGGPILRIEANSGDSGIVEYYPSPNALMIPRGGPAIIDITGNADCFKVSTGESSVRYTERN